MGWTDNAEVGDTSTTDDNGDTTSPAAPAGSNYKTLGYAGAGLQVGAALGQGAAAFYAGRANRAIADQNARIDQFKALAAQNRGTFEANQIGRRGGQIIAGQRTAEAASGVVIGSGTGATLAAQQQGVTMADMAQARNNALMQAWGFTSAAASEGMRGDLAAKAGQQAAVGSAIGGAGLASSDFYRLNN